LPPKVFGAEVDQQELENLKAEVHREFARFASQLSQPDKNHRDDTLRGPSFLEELPEPPKDFNEANALAWLDEVKLKCPNSWARYQERLHRERASEEFQPRRLLSQLLQLLLAFVSAAGILDLSERILKELVVRLAGQEIAATYHQILNISLYGPVAILAAGICLWKMLAFARSPAKDSR